MALQYVAGQRVLELGFGTGHLLLAGSAVGLRMTGLDASPDMQRVARKLLATQGLEGIQVQGRGQMLPFAAGAFDTVLATFPAEFILQAPTLAECARVLGGTAGNRPRRLVIVGLWARLDLAGLEEWIPVFYGRLSAAVRDVLMQRLEEAGFQVATEELRDGRFRIGVVIAELAGVASGTSGAMGRGISSGPTKIRPTGPTPV